MKLYGHLCENNPLEARGLTFVSFESDPETYYKEAALIAKRVSEITQEKTGFLLFFYFYFYHLLHVSFARSI